MSKQGNIRTIQYKGYNICTNNIGGYLVFCNDAIEHAHLRTMADCRNYIDMATHNKEWKGQLITMLLWSIIIYLITLI